jgi:hypothetical protein
MNGEKTNTTDSAMARSRTKNLGTQMEFRSFLSIVCIFASSMQRVVKLGLKSTAVMINLKSINDLITNPTFP